ncbi:MAG: EAL domain-containing protein [Actinomycetota bacterium]
MTAPDTRRAVSMFVALVALAGLASLGLALQATWQAGLGDLRLLALAAAVLFVMSVSPVVFDWKGESGTVSFAEVFFAMLVMTSPPAAVIAVSALDTLFVNVLGRRPLQQLTFNAGLLALSVSSALGVTWLVAGGLPVDPSWRGVAGALAGSVTLYVCSAMGVRAIVAVAGGLSFRRLFAGMTGIELMILSSSASVGVLTGLASGALSLSPVFVIPPLAVIAFVLRQHARAVQGRHQLDHLLETAAAASQSTSSAGVHEVLVDAAGTLLHTADARIQIAPPLDDELGSLIQSDESALWLVARPRSGRGERAEDQAMLDGLAAIGAGALGAAELLERVRHQAFHDTLTGLPNRVLLEDRVSQALKGSEEHAVGVLFINLDLFTRVNESLGHRAADTLLQRVAERILMSLQPSDSAARIGGDEFAVLLPETDARSALEAARWINDAMRKPFTVQEQELVVTASVGVALSPDDGTDFASLLRSADLAMHDAKSAGRDTARRPLGGARGRGGMAFEAELRRALAHDELWVAYQPQIDLASRRIVGTEALVRWAHPARGLLRPDQFLPLAEELGLIEAIDAWVLAQACRQTMAWRASHVPDLRAAVNVSGGLLRSGNLRDLVLTRLRQTGLPTTALEIEVTEKVAVTEGEEALESLVQLRELGVRVAIDDFGTGYSSLSRLRTMPFDIVKIDQSFIREIVDRQSPVPLVTSAISMAHGLGLQTVAEGIETPQQLAFLTDKGCDIGQGYLFGRPVRADKLRPGRSQWAPPAESVPAG